MTFPKDFTWGVATSSCQIEGHAAIRASGAVPAVRLQMNSKLSPDIWVADAVSMVRQLNASSATRVERWIIGNEPDNKSNGHTLETYIAGFIAMFKAMKAVDPAIQIGGPATASYQADEDATVVAPDGRFSCSLKPYTVTTFVVTPVAGD